MNMTTVINNLLSFLSFFGLGIPQTVHTQIGDVYCSFVFSCIQQDGYEQLSLLPARTFKGLIRVRFINEQVSLCVFWSDLSDTKDCVSPLFQTLRRELKLELIAVYFRRILRCLEMWSFEFDISSQLKLKLRRKWRNKIVRVRYQNIITVMISFVKTWWIINDWEWLFFTNVYCG